MFDLWGEKDEDIDFEFVPIGELNESTQSQLKNDIVTRATSLVQSGLADPTEMMETLLQNPELTQELADYKVDEKALAKHNGGELDEADESQKPEENTKTKIKDLSFI
jgi:hypothetical protein